MAAKKSIWKNAGLVLAVSVLCLLAIEGMTRLFLDTGTLYELEMWKYARQVKMRDYRPDIGHRHRANAEAELMGHVVRTNSYGFRGPEIAAQAGHGVVRIAFLGDSVAMGWGVEEQEAFPFRILDALQREGRKVDGYNMGVGNFNTTQEVALYKDVGARLKPDIIVLCYFINDAEPMPDYSENGWLDEHSAAWVVIKYRLDAVIRKLGDAPDWKKYYRGLYADQAPGWAKTQQAIADLAIAARKSGTPLIVFNFPELHELKPYPFEDVTAKVRAIVQRQEVPFVDLLPAVDRLDPPSLWVTVPDPHPNGRADAALADGMVEGLLPLLDELCRRDGKGCLDRQVSGSQNATIGSH